MQSVPEFKQQLAGEARAREAAERRATIAEQRAERAEQSQRALTGEAIRLRTRCRVLEDVIRSLGTPLPVEAVHG